MKKTLCIIVLCFPLIVLGQEKNDFRIDFGFQWNLPEKYFNKSLSKFNSDNTGAGFNIYPKWYFNKSLSLGMNVEYALVQEKANTDNIGAFNVFSFSPTVNYYFLKGKIRPFLGTGIGLYLVSLADKKSSIGIRPIIGVALFDRFNLSFEYSRILGDLQINPLVSKGFGNYYLSLKCNYSLRVGNSRKKLKKI